MQRNPCLSLTFFVCILTLFYLLPLCKDLFRVLQFNTLGQQHFSFSITLCFVVNFPQTTAVTLLLQLPTWFLILLWSYAIRLRLTVIPGTWWHTKMQFDYFGFPWCMTGCYISLFQCAHYVRMSSAVTLDFLFPLFPHFCEALRIPGSFSLSICIVLQLNQTSPSSTRDSYIALQQPTWAKTIILINFHWRKSQHNADIISLKSVNGFFVCLFVFCFSGLLVIL